MTQKILNNPFARRYEVAEFFFGEEADKYLDLVDIAVEQFFVENKDDTHYGIAFQRFLQMDTVYFSSGICETLTAGFGKLDGNGYFEFPLPSKFIKQITAN